MENKKKCSCFICRKNGWRRYKEIKKLGFIMLVFGIITLCAFFLPIKAWIILLGIVLIYCGVKLVRNGSS